MTVRMTADQFFGLTQRRLDQLHWPGYKGEGIKEVRMTVGQLQRIKKTLQDIEANRKGQNGPNLDQEDNKEEQERKATKNVNGGYKPVIIKDKTQNNVINGYVKKVEGKRDKKDKSLKPIEKPSREEEAERRRTALQETDEKAKNGNKEAKDVKRKAYHDDNTYKNNRYAGGDDGSGARTEQQDGFADGSGTRT